VTVIRLQTISKTMTLENNLCIKEPNKVVFCRFVIAGADIKKCFEKARKSRVIDNLAGWQVAMKRR